jgi:hypothetical protein
LSPTQRAAVAVEALPRLEEEAQKRQLAGVKYDHNLPPKLAEGRKGDARDHAADLVGASHTYVSDLKAIKGSHPELYRFW